MAASRSCQPRSRRWVRPVVFGLLIVTLLVLGRVVPIGMWLESSSQHLRHAGPLGAVIFVLSYSLGALLFVPSAMFTFVAGFTYGAFVGTLIGIPGIATSALLVFALAKTLLRKPVESWLRRDPRFVAVDRLIARLGARAVVLLRLSPLSPFSVLNYAFGLTGIPLGRYFLATSLGTVPGALFFAHLGAVAPQLSGIADGHLPSGGSIQTLFLLLGLGVTAAVAIWLGKLARSAMRESTTVDVDEPLSDEQNSPK